MMDREEKQRLLAACVKAQRDYENAVERVEELKQARREVFAEALRTPVKATEIAELINLSSAQVGRISKGQR